MAGFHSHFDRSPAELVRFNGGLEMSTWSASSNDYNDTNNWTFLHVPTDIDIAFFGPSSFTSPSSYTIPDMFVGEWIFQSGSPQYSFTIDGAGAFNFVGAGIITNGVSVSITVSSGAVLFFENASTAGSAAITENGGPVEFDSLSTGGTASITNTVRVTFTGYSSAGSAAIHTPTYSGFNFRRGYLPPWCRPAHRAFRKCERADRRRWRLTGQGGQGNADAERGREHLFRRHHLGTRRA